MKTKMYKFFILLLGLSIGLFTNFQQVHCSKGRLILDCSATLVKSLATAICNGKPDTNNNHSNDDLERGYIFKFWHEGKLNGNEQALDDFFKNKNSPNYFLNWFIKTIRDAKNIKNGDKTLLETYPIKFGDNQDEGTLCYELFIDIMTILITKFIYVQNDQYYNPKLAKWFIKKFEIPTEINLEQNNAISNLFKDFCNKHSISETYTNVTPVNKSIIDACLKQWVNPALKGFYDNIGLNNKRVKEITHPERQPLCITFLRLVLSHPIMLSVFYGLITYPIFYIDKSGSLITKKSIMTGDPSSDSFNFLSPIMGSMTCVCTDIPLYVATRIPMILSLIYCACVFMVSLTNLK